MGILQSYARQKEAKEEKKVSNCNLWGSSVSQQDMLLTIGDLNAKMGNATLKEKKQWGVMAAEPSVTTKRGTSSITET